MRPAVVAGATNCATATTPTYAGPCTTFSASAAMPGTHPCLTENPARSAAKSRRAIPCCRNRLARSRRQRRMPRRAPVPVRGDGLGGGHGGDRQGESVNWFVEHQRRGDQGQPGHRPGCGTAACQYAEFQRLRGGVSSHPGWSASVRSVSTAASRRTVAACSAASVRLQRRPSHCACSSASNYQCAASAGRSRRSATSARLPRSRPAAKSSPATLAQRKQLVQCAVFRALRLPGLLGKFFQVPLRAVQRRLRKGLVHGLDVHGVKRMQVQDRPDALAAVGKPAHLIENLRGQGQGIQKRKATAGQAHQQGLGADVDEPADADGSADVPEVVADLEPAHRTARGCLGTLL